MSAIPDYGTIRTMWKHPDRIWAYFVSDEDRTNGFITYKKKWEAVGGVGEEWIRYEFSQVEFFPAPQLNRGRRR